MRPPPAPAHLIFTTKPNPQIPFGAKASEQLMVRIARCEGASYAGTIRTLGLKCAGQKSNNSRQKHRLRLEWSFVKPVI